MRRVRWVGRFRQRSVRSAQRRTILWSASRGTVGSSTACRNWKRHARRGIKTVTVVNNNHSLSQGLRNLTAAYGDRDRARMGECFEYRETDFARVAQSFDCFGVIVDEPENFRKAFDQALASDLPAVIDVRTEFGAIADLPWVPA